MPPKNKAAHRIEKDGSVTLRLEVAQCSPDIVQYKPYQTSFVPIAPVQIEVHIEAEYVIETNPTVVLSPEGWFIVAKRISTGSMKAHVRAGA